jgi:hypothetical protein
MWAAIAGVVAGVIYLIIAIAGGMLASNQSAALLGTLF